jgi:hypothetical protein
MIGYKDMSYNRQFTNSPRLQTQVLISVVTEFEQPIPAMAKATTVAGSVAAADMWKSQYFAPVVVLMPVITKW